MILSRLVSSLKRVFLLGVFASGELALSQTSPAPALGSPGKLQRQVWFGFPSHVLSELTASPRFYLAPSSTNFVDSSYHSVGDAYGARLRGYLTAPTTGLYTFWAAGDDQVELALSTNAFKEQRRTIIQNYSWTHHQSFDQKPSQKSAPIFLKAGDRYYLEALQKEGVGLDHFSLAWAMQGLDEAKSEQNWATPQHGAVATASSNAGNIYPASQGIDGNPNTFFQTAGEVSPWWMIDFGKSRHVNRVEILNRQDCCQTRASNFRAEFLDANQQVIHFKDFYVASGSMGSAETWVLSQPLAARYLRFRLLGSNRAGDFFLQFAEVQAYGKDTLGDVTARQLIPSTALHAYTPIGTSDADDDTYPDSWERLHGFAVGYETGDRAASADLDGDGRSNLIESNDGTNPFLADGLPGHLIRQEWQNFAYYSLSASRENPRLFQKPDQTYFHNSSLISWLNGYSAGRIRGFITPSESAHYRFWIASGESAEFWLSTKPGDPAHKQKICALGSELGTANGTTSWDAFSPQMSREVWLEAGKSYYIEANYQLGHGGNRIVNLAWAKRGGARSSIAPVNLSSYYSSKTDQDDDLLPDSWEQQHGLSPTDAGGTDLRRQGEFGDFDGDGFNNREEYVLGTNPAAADSDGDGISDYEELTQYKTSPIQSNSVAGKEIPAPALTAYNAANTTANWIHLDGGLMANSFRSKIEWSFTVPSDGWWVMDVETRLRGTLRNSEELAVGLRIDGKALAPQTLRYLHGKASSLKLLTPFLKAGTHTFELDNRNEVGRRNLQIFSLKIAGVGGFDGDNNGRPDWVDSLIAEGNSLLPLPQQSVVSPIFIEGSSRYVGAVGASAGGNAMPIQRGLGDLHWFANAPLQANGTTALRVDLEDKQQSQSIEWVRWNALGASPLTLRLGDSVKIGAWLSTADLAPVSITLDGKTEVLRADGFLVKQFTRSGVYPISVIHQGIARSAATITVLAADFGVISCFYSDVPSWRSLPRVPSALVLEGEPSLQVDARQPQASGQRALLRSFRPGSHALAARLPDSGAIVALGEVSTLGFSDALKHDAATFVGSSADGFRILRTPIMLTDLPPGGKVVMTIFRAGVTFLNGTTVLTLGADSFRNGVAYVDFRYPANLQGGYCHYTDVYDADGRHLGRR